MKLNAFATPQISLHQGHCIEILKQLPSESVNCCVTSPPYFNLRQYQTEPQIWGGSIDCEHEWVSNKFYREGGATGGKAEAFQAGGQTNADRIKATRWKKDDRCSKCSAWRGELGQEKAPQAFVSHLVDIFAEVYRVLKKDGVAWVNMADSYADKSLLLVPQRLAIALQDFGWIIRSEIIWSKKSAMPDPTVDRCTRSHEQIWMLTKSERYWSNFDAIKEPSVSGHPSGNGFKREARVSYQNADGTARCNDEQWTPTELRNCRDVWHLSPEFFKGEHYAAYPTEIPRRCIASTCPPDGVVLDPFAGTGTTLFVAQEMGRRAIGCELNPDYIEIAARRCRQLTIFGSGEATA